MKLVETQLVRDFTKMCHDGYQLGWHEGNGGNISYRMREAEVAEVRDELDESRSAAPSKVWPMNTS